MKPAIRTIRFLSIVFTFIGLLFAASPAKATTITECMALIDTLITTTNGVTFGGNNPTRTQASLVSKLMGAKDKLNQGKFPDAVNKLEQYRDKVMDLKQPNAKGQTKIDPTVADGLIQDANEVIACVNNIGLP